MKSDIKSKIESILKDFQSSGHPIRATTKALTTLVEEVEVTCPYCSLDFKVKEVNK